VVERWSLTVSYVLDGLELFQVTLSNLDISYRCSDPAYIYRSLWTYYSWTWVWTGEGELRERKEREGDGRGE